MAKIRGIKPEFWTDDAIVELSRDARLFFIGLWSFACDNGHVADKPKQLRMRIFPGDDDTQIEAWLTELVEQRRITRADGIITILRFAEHQRPHKRWWTTCDAPRCALPDDAPPQGRNRGTTGSQPLHNGGATADGDGDGDGEKPPKLPTRIPVCFDVTPEMRDWAFEKDYAHLDLDALTEEFVDFWRGASKNATKLDWVATWRNRVRDVAERKPQLRIAASRGQQPEGW